MARQLACAHWVVFGFAVFITLFHSTEADLNDAIFSNGSCEYCKCGLFCDANGDTRDPEKCQYFCCGTLNDRWCCKSAFDQNICITCSNNNPCETTSNESDWWIYQWRLVTGVVCAMLVSMIVVVGCYFWRYYDCKCPCYPRWHTRHRRRTASTSPNRTAPSHPPDEISMEIDLHTRDFDPNSIFAFEPPAYETLPKDPPCYTEVYGAVESAYDNSSFAPGPEQSQAANSAEQPVIRPSAPQDDDPPPSYTASYASEATETN